MTQICTTINLSPLELNSTCTRCMPISVQPTYWADTFTGQAGFVSSSGEIYRPSTGRVAVDMPLYCLGPIPPGSPTSINLTDANPISIRVVGPNPNNTIFYKLPNGYNQTYNITSPWVGCGNSKFQYVADPANSLVLRPQTASMWVIESKEHPTKPLSFNPGVVTVEIKDSIGGVVKFETLEVSDYDNKLLISSQTGGLKVANKVLNTFVSNGGCTYISEISAAFVDINYSHSTPNISSYGFVDKGTHFECRIYADEIYSINPNCSANQENYATRIENIEVDQTASTYPNANLFSTFFDNSIQMWKLKIMKLNGAMPPNILFNQDLFFKMSRRITTPQGSGISGGGIIGISTHTRNNLSLLQTNLSSYPIIPEC